MRARRKDLIRLLPLLMLTLALGCAQPPPNLSPKAQTAFKAMQVQRSLDEIRDIAIAANATTPPLLSERTTGTIVTWHRSTIIVVNAAQDGWEEATLRALDELQSRLAVAERPLIAPYITLAVTIIKEVMR